MHNRHERGAQDSVDEPSLSEARRHLQRELLRQHRFGAHLPNVVRTPVGSLDKYGVGVSLYFSFMLGLSGLMVTCGIATLPVVLHNKEAMRNMTLSGNSTHVKDDGTGFETLRGTVVGMDDTYGSRMDVFIMEMIVTALLLAFIVVYDQKTRRRRNRTSRGGARGTHRSAPLSSPQFPATITPGRRALVIEHLPKDLYVDTDGIQEFYEMVLRPSGETTTMSAHRVESVVLQRNNARMLLAAAELELARRRLRHLTHGVEGRAEDASDVSRVERVGWVQRFLWYVYFGRGIRYWRWLARFSAQYLERAKEGPRGRASKQPVRAFVVFRSEADRNRAMRLTQRGFLERCLAEDPLGRCPAREAPEPSDVQWDVPHISTWLDRLTKFLSNLCTLLILGFSFWVLFQLQRIRSLYSTVSTFTSDPSTAGGTVEGLNVVSTLESFVPGVFISSLNLLLPPIIKGLVLGIEFHTTHSSLQASMLRKLVFTRILNSAVIPFLATPSNIMADDGVLRRLQSVLFADLIIRNSVRLLDPFTLFVRYVWARFARSRADLNDLWSPATWNLAERYTDAFSTFAFTTFFGSLLPSAYWVAALTLVVAYWVDKRLLFNHWQRAPSMDDTVARSALSFFVIISAGRMCVSAWIMANWPLSLLPGDASNSILEVNLSDKMVLANAARGTTVVHIASAALVVLSSIGVYVRRRVRRCCRATFVGSVGRGESIPRLGQLDLNLGAGTGRTGPDALETFEPRLWIESGHGSKMETGNRFLRGGFENEVSWFVRAQAQDRAEDTV